MYLATPDGPVDYTTAHAPIQDDDGEGEDSDCFERFDQLWHQHLHAVGANTLHLELELGGYRWYLGDEALHACTPIDLLAADDTWIPGRFEYDNRPTARPPSSTGPSADGTDPKPPSPSPTELCCAYRTGKRPVGV